MIEMKETALMNYISSKLRTVVCRITTSGDIVERINTRYDLRDPVISHGVLYKTLLENASYDTPLIITVNNVISYGISPCKGGYYFVGPNKFEKSAPLLHKISGIDLADNPGETLHRCSLAEYTEALMLLYNMTHEHQISDLDFVNANCIDDSLDEKIMKKFVHLMHENSETSSKHNPYDQETREFSAIEHGATESLLNAFQEKYEGKIGTLAKDPLRNAKNLGIVVITLASRAAIRGGMPPEVSFSLSDSYIQMFEEARDIPTVNHMMRSAEIQYTEMVKSIREGRGESERSTGNPHVKECKQYVQTHINDKLSVASIAAELGLNPNYLSNIFVRQENKTLSKYITKEKIKRAKDLLVYSSKSCAEISEDLGFSSQSYFGKKFTEITGLTPAAYRAEYSSSWVRRK